MAFKVIIYIVHSAIVLSKYVSITHSMSENKAVLYSLYKQTDLFNISKINQRVTNYF